MNISITSYLNDLTDTEFHLEFLDMIDSSELLTITYCRKCYSKVNIKEIFGHTVKLYILNSNGINCYGYYMSHFKLIAKKHNLLFDKSHVFKHRKPYSRYRNRISSISRHTNIPQININSSNELQLVPIANINQTTNVNNSINYNLTADDLMTDHLLTDNLISTNPIVNELSIDTISQSICNQIIETVKNNIETRYQQNLEEPESIISNNIIINDTVSDDKNQTFFPKI